MSISPNFSIKTLPGKYRLLGLCKQYPERYPCLLQSTAQSLDTHNPTARYDILMAFPQQQLRKTWQGELWLDDKLLENRSFLAALNDLYHAEKISEDNPLPFTGGWFVYLGYELASEIEPVLELPVTDQSLPVASATRIPAAIIYDHVKKSTFLVAETKYEYCLEYMMSDLNLVDEDSGAPQRLPTLLNEEPEERYVESVRKVLDYIYDGDVFQVNLSRQWSLNKEADITPDTIYERLTTTNPAPFAAYAKIDAAYILSSSPERLVRVKGGKIETRPIAGTRPRSPDSQSDKLLQAELISNIKERAEHVMLIDLERNDLGRVCTPGTIHVDEMMCIESYAHVHHIVSNITGHLKTDMGPGEVIAAVFPGGTITGCPKVRCMQIIQELEQSPRGAYTGSLGYLNRNGDMDLNILIRTIVVAKDSISVRAGAGLVADSVPEHELEETRSKAKGMLLALTG